jgi:hypothetical protein
LSLSVLEQQRSSTTIPPKLWLNPRIVAQRKGGNVHVGTAAPPRSIIVAITSSTESGVAINGNRVVPTTARKQNQDNKYPLWNYVAKRRRLEDKSIGGQHCYWAYNFCNIKFKSTYF